MARQAKTILSGGLALAVMANVLPPNPTNDAVSAARPAGRATRFRVLHGRAKHVGPSLPYHRDWRRVREDLGVPEVTTHSFRKTVATLIGDRGLSARIGADQLGHPRPSMNQERNVSRGKLHQSVADLLDAATNDG
jgi:integrase